MSTEADRLIQRAREAYERRDFVAALSDFREVVDNHPHFADVRQMMGLCLSFLGQPDAALEQFERALEENECYVEALLHKAITLNELGRYDDARDAFEKAGECEGRFKGRFPTSVSGRIANAHLAVGELYLAAAAPDEAAAEFRRALELRPGFHDIRNRLGEALLQLGDLEAARQELERALEGNGRFFRARLNLGLVRYRSGELDRAREAWEECRAQDPNSPQVRSYLRLLDSNPEHASDAS